MFRPSCDHLQAFLKGTVIWLTFNFVYWWVQLPTSAPIIIIITPDMFRRPLWRHHQGFIHYNHHRISIWFLVVLIFHSCTIMRMVSLTSSVCDISHRIRCTVQGYVTSQDGLHLFVKGLKSNFIKKLASRDHREFAPPKTTQYTVNSTFSLNCKVQP
jgi:hypothetical protein